MPSVKLQSIVSVQCAHAWRTQQSLVHQCQGGLLDRADIVPVNGSLVPILEAAMRRKITESIVATASISQIATAGCLFGPSFRDHRS